jgi:hypothetical protein
MVDQFYENLLGVSTDRENTINLNELGISSYNLSDLDLPFTEESVVNYKEAAFRQSTRPRWTHRAVLQIMLADH